MKFTKEFLFDRMDDGKHILKEVEDHSRWNVHYRMVFEFDGKFYETCYKVGATEMQDNAPYEYEEDEIECDEVFPVEKTTTIYEGVKKQ